MPSVRIRPAVVLFGLIAATASAENPERANAPPDSPSRLRNLTTLIPSPDGSFLTAGGSALRRLAPGAQKLELIHRIPGDGLYRVAGDASGAILATWEKDGALHYFHGHPRKHVVIPAPRPPTGELSGFSIQHLALLPGGDAIILMRGHGRKSRAGDIYAAYRVRLARRETELLYRVDGARLVTRHDDLAIYLLPPPGKRCDLASCPSRGEVVAYRLGHQGSVERTVLLRKEDEVDAVRPIWGDADAPIVMLLNHPRNARSLLRWSPRIGKVERQPFPLRAPGEHFYALASGDVLRLVHHVDEALDIQRHRRDGSVQSTRLLSANDAETVDTDLYDLGTRANGALWLHWGDFLLLFEPDFTRHPRAYSIEHLLARRQEWGGVGIYVRSPEALWIAIEVQSGRDFARLSFAEMERNARPWNPPRMAEDAEY